MARFEFFDSYATQSGSLTSYSSQSESRPYNLCEECGDAGSETRFETVREIVSRTYQYALGFLSASNSVSFVTSLPEFPESDQLEPYSAIGSSTRNHATNPTFTAGVGTATQTETGGYTFRTTGTTTQIIGQKEATISTGSPPPFSGSFIWTYGGALKTATSLPDYVNSDGLGYAPAGNAFSSPISFGTTTQATGITLTVSTTLTGYAFCQPIRNAAFLYTLDPRKPGAGSSNERLSPAYWVTTPLSEGVSFSAINTTGSHRIFDLSSVSSTHSSSSSSEWELLCLAGITETWSALYEPGCPLDASSFTESLYTHYGSYASSSQSAETQAVWKTYGTTGPQPENQYRRKGLGKPYYVDPLADPSTAVIYTSYTLNNSTLALSITANSYDSLVVVSQHGGHNCYTPAYFTGIRPGTTGVITGISTTATQRVNVSWLSTSAIGFTAKTSTASTDTVSSQVGFVKSSAQTSDYVTATEAMDIHLPPLMRRTGTEFEPVTSYGVSDGTYKLASTNSTGGTASQTASGIVSSVVDSSAYGRPQRKIAYSYASTTGSGYSYGYSLNPWLIPPSPHYLFNIWDGQMPAFSSIYGGIAGYGRADVLVEESRGDNLGSRRVF